MRVEAGNGCWLTESYDIQEIKDRRFVKAVTVTSADELAQWREITDTEKEKMQAQMFEVDAVDADYLDKLDVMLRGVAEKINGAGLTAAQALEKKEYFPKWKDETGKEHYAGYRFQYGGTLYEKQARNK